MLEQGIPVGEESSAKHKPQFHLLDVSYLIKASVSFEIFSTDFKRYFSINFN